MIIISKNLIQTEKQNKLHIRSTSLDLLLSLLAAATEVLNSITETTHCKIYIRI
jgi:hypothetical protein